MQEDLHKELHSALIGTILLDVLFWIGSLLFLKFSPAFLIGLLLGSIGMIVNLFLLRNTILNAVYHGKTRDLSGYLIRILIASTIIAVALISDSVNAVAAVLPFLYPKLIFGFLAVRTNTHP